MSRTRRGARGRVFLLEPLEDRRLLANAFTGPSLSGLIQEAYNGKDTAQATIKTMLSALQTQLTNGPLADLNNGSVVGDGFIQEAQSLVASFNQNVDQQLSPRFPHIDTMLKLQGQAVVANLVSLNQQSDIGLTSSANLPTVAGAAINMLTSGPIYSLNTPVSAYITTTQTFETNLATVTDTLSSSSSTPLALSDVSTTIQAEAEGYRAYMDAGLQVTHANLSARVNAAVTTLESSVIAIANANSSTAQSDISAAIATFDSTILDTTGLFGLNGPVVQVNSERGYVPIDLTGKQAATTISAVSGTAVVGGSATITATLNTSSGTGLVGKVISFTVDGAFAGIAITGSNGVATLTGVPQSDVAGTDASGILASFAGDSTNLLSQNSGDLTVSQASTTTTLTSSANPSSVGTSVTFTATVAPSTGSGTPTGTVTFMNGTTTLGTGTLSSSDTATFSTSSLAQGTQSITAVYGGDTNFTTSTSSILSQVVNLGTTTTVTASPSTSVFGQSVTFTATVAPTSGSGTPTGPVTFMNGTTTLGTGTLSSGVATLSTSTLAVGTQSITAVYGGDSTYGTSTSTALSHVVSQSTTTTTITSGTNPSVFGQSVTFTANVAPVSPGVGTPTGSVSFMEGSTTLVTGTLSSSGVATFSSSTLAVGTLSITAVYGGDTNFATSTSTAVSQVVNQASTTTALTSNPNPSTSGTSVTFTATVAAVTPGTGTPTGTVNFLDGVTSIGSETLDSSGVAALSTSTLTVGTHSITAAYVASTDYSASTSSIVTQVVS